MLNISQKQTAKNAIEMLCNSNRGFRELGPHEKKNLAMVFAEEYKVALYGNAFDLVQCQGKVDFTRTEDIKRNLESIIVYEVKSTNKKNLSKDFRGYFFDLTTSELLVAQSLGTHFKFAFVNTVNSFWSETDIQGLLSCARKIYPKWAITLGSLPAETTSVSEKDEKK